MELDDEYVRRLIGHFYQLCEILEAWDRTDDIPSKAARIRRQEELTSAARKLYPYLTKLDWHAVPHQLAQKLGEAAVARGVDPKPFANFVGGVIEWRDKTLSAAISHLEMLLRAAPTAPNTSAAAMPIAYQPNDAEQAIIEMLRKHGHRMTTDDVIAEMEERGHRSGVKDRLAVLKRAQLLDTATDARGKGYGLREWSRP